MRKDVSSTKKEGAIEGSSIKPGAARPAEAEHLRMAEQRARLRCEKSEVMREKRAVKR